MYASRWLTLSASAALQCSAGVSYCFSVYSGQLKDALGYSQTQVEGLASPLVALLVVGWLPGVVYDALRHRHHLGPRVVLAVGLAEHFCGYFGLWLAATGRLALPYFGTVCLAVMAFNGANWVDTACIATNIRNFPAHRGNVVGVLKSLVGLSASIYTSVYAATLKPDGLSFLLVIACAPLVAGLLAMPLFNAVPSGAADGDSCKQEAAGARFAVAIYVVMLLGAYQLMSSGLLGGVPSERMGPLLRAGMLGGLALLLAPVLLLWLQSGPLLVRQQGEPGQTSAVDEERAELIGSRHGELGEQGAPHSGVSVQISPRTSSDKFGAEALRQPLICTRQGDAAGQPKGASLKVPQQPASLPSMTVWACCTSANFWLLFVIFGVGTGCGLMFVNNLGQLVESIGATQQGPDVLVSLFSIASAAGRLACGSVPDHFLQTRAIPRTLFLTGVAGLTAAAAALASTSRVALLWAAAPAAGFAFGCHWSLMPPLAGELFGMRSFATLYCLLTFSTTFGTYALATRLAGGLYQWRARLHGDTENLCFGADCFRLTFLIAAALELGVMCLSFVLYCRTRSLYHRKVTRASALREAEGDVDDPTLPGREPSRVAP